MSALELALTFDDGPGPSTERLLAVLAGHRVRATFFLLGRNLAGGAIDGDGQRAHELAARAVRDGHVLGNHTMTHAPELPPAELLAEVAACDDLIRAIHVRAGRPAPESIPVRLPYGPFRPDGARCLETLEDAGRPHCHWTGDPQDWKPGQTAAQITAAALEHVEKAWQRGRAPILLLHDAGQSRQDEFGVVREATVDAVDRICAALAEKPVRYLTIPECDPRRYRLPVARARA